VANQGEAKVDRLSDYVRAVCYYKLPRVTSPVTIGLVVAYAICLLEAVAALAFGYFTERPVWTKSGAIALGGIIAFGIVAFLIRALLNDIHRRRALAAAAGTPDASAEADDLPDPFAHHILLRASADIQSETSEITDNNGERRYVVTRNPEGNEWNVESTEGGDALELTATVWGGSFSLFRNAPTHLTVRRDRKETAKIRRRFTLGSTEIDISCLEPEKVELCVKGFGLYKNDKLVGRVYSMRRFNYLDVEKEYFHDGILGFFITMV